MSLLLLLGFGSVVSEFAVAVLFIMPKVDDGDTVAMMFIVITLPELISPSDSVQGLLSIGRYDPPFIEYLGLINWLNHVAIKLSVNITLFAVSGPKFVMVTV